MTAPRRKRKKKKINDKPSHRPDSKQKRTAKEEKTKNVVNDIESDGGFDSGEYICVVIVLSIIN